MAFNDENFIFAKVVDRSLLRQGFTLPVKMLWGFKQWFGELAPGESRSVIIRLKGREFFGSSCMTVGIRSRHNLI